ncbi:MAG: hypothetical protein U0793_03475 [Gemmataceae bacterium]
MCECCIVCFVPFDAEDGEVCCEDCGDDALDSLISCQEEVACA